MAKDRRLRAGQHQSYLNALCLLIGVNPPNGSLADDAANDYAFERQVFQDNGDGTRYFGRIDFVIQIQA